MNEPALLFYDFSTKSTNTVVTGDRLWGTVTLSADGRSILYGRIDEIGSDLMLVENFRQTGSTSVTP